MSWHGHRLAVIGRCYNNAAYMSRHRIYPEDAANSRSLPVLDRNALIKAEPPDRWRCSSAMGEPRTVISSHNKRPNSGHQQEIILLSVLALTTVAASSTA